MGYIGTDKTILDFLPQIEKALELGHGTHTALDVMNRLLAGECDLWVEGDGLLVTKVEQWPQKRVMRFWIAAGKLEDVLALEARVIESARAHGCDGMVIDGRKGWAKVLSDGWQEDNTRSFTKALTNG